MKSGPEEDASILNWAMRLKIALDVAQGTKISKDSRIELPHIIPLANYFFEIFLFSLHPQASITCTTSASHLLFTET